LAKYDRDTLFVCVVGQPVVVDSVSRAVLHSLREGDALHGDTIELRPIFREDDETLVVNEPCHVWYRSDLEVYTITGLNRDTLNRLDGRHCVVLTTTGEQRNEEVDEEKTAVHERFVGHGGKWD
jgi:hypothetical protein